MLNQIQTGKVTERLHAMHKTSEPVLDALFLRTLVRKPTAEERVQLGALCNEATDKVAAYRDVFWALLNSSEFLFNH